jgi:hypothetical protein
LQDLPKCTQIGIFWSENEPSGNPYSRQRLVWSVDKAQKQTLMSGADVMIFIIFSPKNLAKKLAFLTQIHIASLRKN